MKATLYILAGALAILALILLSNSRSAIHETVVTLVGLTAVVAFVGAVLAGWLERIFDSLEQSRVAAAAAARAAKPLAEPAKDTNWQSEEDRVRHWEAAEQRLREKPLSTTMADTAASIIAQSQATAESLRDLRR